MLCHIRIFSSAPISRTREKKSSSPPLFRIEVDPLTHPRKIHYFLQKVANPELKSLMDIFEGKLVIQELRSLERSFEAAQRTMDQIKCQITKVSKEIEDKHYFDYEALVYRFRKEIRTLKQKIPYSLIYPPSSTKTNNPDMVHHPRDSHDFSNKGSIQAEPFYFEMNENDDLDRAIKIRNPVYRFLDRASIDPALEYLEQHLHSLPHDYCIPILECLMCFPQHMIIKKSVFRKSFLAQSELSSRLEYNEAMKYLVEHGFFMTVQKNTSMDISGYWIPPIPYRVLQHFFQSRSSATKESLHFSPCPSKEPQVLYSSNDFIIENVKSVKALLLGKWRKQSPGSQHIEIEDPSLFYKSMEKLTEVKYISLRGISMITEIPQFITKLKKLKILDCKECHDLEVIPHSIKKLWRTLTHLDMSDCFLLDHMPPPLSDLIHLEVLKGFYVGEPSQQRKTCTLQNLAKLSKLQELHINISVKGFPSTGHLTDLQKLKSLVKLTITWRPSRTRDEKSTTSSATDSTPCGGDKQQFSFHLDKLDLRCVPNTVTRDWLNPVVFKGLKKLCIRGGHFFDLGQRLGGELEEDNASVIVKGKQWAVEELRLRYLSELRIDKSELSSLFPKLEILEVEDCSKFTSSGNRNNGIFWFS